MKKILVLIAVVAFMTTSAFAQTQFRLGITAGLELSNMNAEYDGESMNDLFDSKAGFKAGILGEFAFNNFFAIEPGILFSQRGFRTEGSGEVMGGVTYSFSDRLNINYLTVPVNAKLSLPIGRNFRVFCFAGPYFAFALAGTETAETTMEGTTTTVTTDIEFGSGDEELSRFDFGLNFGAGVEISGIFVRVQYNLGLTNLSNFDGATQQNRNLGISLGFMF